MIFLHLHNVSKLKSSPTHIYFVSLNFILDSLEKFKNNKFYTLATLSLPNVFFVKLLSFWCFYTVLNFKVCIEIF